MAQLLYGTPIANRMKTELSDWVRTQDFSDRYVAIIHTGDNPASATYVRMKQRFAQDISLPVRVLGQDGSIQTPEQLLDLVKELAQDDRCIAFMPQLPLDRHLHSVLMQVFDAIPAQKDIDGLGSESIGKYITEQHDIL